jgi:hypothetical protein
MELIKFGSNLRHTSNTSMNERSSRSHSILKIVIESKYKGNKKEDENEEDENAIKISTLYFVGIKINDNI